MFSKYIILFSECSILEKCCNKADFLLIYPSYLLLILFLFRVLEILGKVGEVYSLIKNGEYWTQKKNYGLLSFAINATSFRGFSLRYSNSSIVLDKMYTENGNAADVSISLPETAFRIDKSSKSSFVCLIYDDSKLFQSDGASQVNGKIISAEIRNQSVGDMSVPVVISFKKTDQKRKDSSCVWWDFKKSGKNLYYYLSILYI